LLEKVGETRVSGVRVMTWVHSVVDGGTVWGTGCVLADEYTPVVRVSCTFWDKLPLIRCV